MNKAKVAARIMLAIVVSTLFNGMARATVNVMGGVSCGSWIEEREKRNRGGDALGTIVQERWFVGYLSGLAVGSGKEFWGAPGVSLMDNKSAYLWADNYCRTNPLKNLDDAGLVLFSQRATAISAK